MNHRLSLKVFDPEVLTMKSFKFFLEYLGYSWCLTHVEGMFADEEMPLSFLPFVGAICCGSIMHAPFPN